MKNLSNKFVLTSCFTAAFTLFTSVVFAQADDSTSGQRLRGVSSRVPGIITQYIPPAIPGATGGVGATGATGATGAAGATASGTMCGSVALTGCPNGDYDPYQCGTYIAACQGYNVVSSFSGSTISYSCPSGYYGKTVGTEVYHNNGVSIYGGYATCVKS